MGNELSNQTEDDSIATVDLVGRLREAVDAAKARRAHERDHEVEDTKGVTWHQTGPDEAHERFRCDVTKCGWQPAGEQHTGSLTGQGSPISDEMVETAGRTYYENLGWDWNDLGGWDEDQQRDRDHEDSKAAILREFRAVLEATYPAIRQHVAEQIAREVISDWRRSADEDERYLNRAHASEIHDLYASIRINREHADALEAIIARELGGGQ